MTRSITLLGALVAVLSVTGRADAALNAYLTMTGETQGQVQGSVTQAGREGMMEIYGFSHEVISPRDAASGLPTGKRQHRPVVLTKSIGKATPILFAMLTQNENVTEFKLRFYQQDPTRGEVHYYSIELVNASIAGIRTEMLNNKYPENMRHEVREHISFTYDKIIWTWEDGGITAEDDWETPVVFNAAKRSADLVASAATVPERRSFWARRAQRGVEAGEKRNAG